MLSSDFPNIIHTGPQGHFHIQGIAVDAEKGYLYCSFTTRLIKLGLDGTLIGSVENLGGHLGCIAFCKSDGRVYGALEYLNDEIGTGIQQKVGADATTTTEAFYAVMFDVDKIDRVGMDAFSDGVMTAVYLNEAVADYLGTGTDKNGNTVAHKYGCSGIDGMTIGPMFGANDGREYLFVDCGPYDDLTRDDNDNMVIQCYALDELKKYELPLDLKALHTNGPEKPVHKLFCRTGNTAYGIQNLEYDEYTNSYLAAVYRGRKPEFPNYDMFAFDASVAPEYTDKTEYEGFMTLLKFGETDPRTGISGMYFPYGSTGLYSFGDGFYYMSEDYSTEEGKCSTIRKYRLIENSRFECVE